MKLLHQNHVKYGLYMTAVIILCLAVMEFTGNNKSFEHSPIVFFFTAIAPAIVWFLGMTAKKKLQKGKLTYKQAFLEGVKISVVYAIVSPFVFLFYYLAINPDIIQYVKEVYKMPNASDNAAIMMDLTVQVIGALLGGTLYAAILAFFVKSKKK